MTRAEIVALAATYTTVEAFANNPEVADYIMDYEGDLAILKADCETAVAGRADAVAATWPVRWTVAPPSYDGMGTRSVDDGTYRGKPLRQVHIPPQQLDWQTSRYQSGLCGCFVTDPRKETT